MRIKLLSLLLASGLAYPLIATPEVECEFIYSKAGVVDSSEDYAVGPSFRASLEGTGVMSHGFVIEAKIQEERAQGSRPMPVFAHSLEIKIKKDNAESYISVLLPKDGAFHRYSTRLKVAEHEGFVNCDLKTKS